MADVHEKSGGQRARSLLIYIGRDGMVVDEGTVAVRWWGTEHLHPDGSVNEELAMQDFEFLASIAPQNAKSVDHFFFSWPPEENPDDNQCYEVVEEFRKQARLGPLDGRQGVLMKAAVHRDGHCTHVHIACTRVEPEYLRDPDAEIRMRRLDWCHESLAKTCAVMEHRYCWSSVDNPLYVMNSKGQPVKNRARGEYSGDAAGGGGAADFEYRTNTPSAKTLAAQRINAILNDPRPPVTWSDFVAAIKAADMTYTVTPMTAKKGALVRLNAVVGVLQEDGSYKIVKASGIPLAIGSTADVRNAGVADLSKLFLGKPPQEMGVAEIAAAKIKAILGKPGLDWPQFLQAAEQVGIRYAIRKPKKIVDGKAGAADVQIQVQHADGTWASCLSSSVRLNLKIKGLDKPLGDASYKMLKRVLLNIDIADIKHYEDAEQVDALAVPKKKRKPRTDVDYRGQLRVAATEWWRQRRAANANFAEAKQRFIVYKTSMRVRLRALYERGEHDQRLALKAQFLLKEQEFAAKRLELEREVQDLIHFESWLRRQEIYTEVSLERAKNREAECKGHALPAGGVKEDATSKRRFEALIVFVGMTAQAINNGVVQYFIGTTVAIEDHGSQVWFKSSGTEGVRAGLILSLQKFGHVRLSSKDFSFLRVAAREAVRMGVQDRICSDNPVFQREVEHMLRMQESRKNARNPCERERRIASMAKEHATICSALGHVRYLVQAEEPFRKQAGSHHRVIGDVRGIRTEAGAGEFGQLAATRFEDALRDAKASEYETITMDILSADRMHIVLSVNGAGLEALRKKGHQSVVELDLGDGRYQVVLAIRNPSNFGAVNAKARNKVEQLLRDQFGVGSEPAVLRCPGDGQVKVAVTHRLASCPVMGALVKEIAGKLEADERAADAQHGQMSEKVVKMAPDQKKALELQALWATHRSDVLHRIGSGSAGVDESILDWMVCTRLIVTGHEIEEVRLALMIGSRRMRGDMNYARETMDRLAGAPGILTIERNQRYQQAWKKLEESILRGRRNRQGISRGK